jgi:hypothetical protein
VWYKDATFFKKQQTPGAAAAAAFVTHAEPHTVLYTCVAAGTLAAQKQQSAAITQLQQCQGHHLQ